MSTSVRIIHSRAAASPRKASVASSRESQRSIFTYPGLPILPHSRIRDHVPKRFGCMLSYWGDQYVIKRARKPMAAIVPLWHLEAWLKRRDGSLEWWMRCSSGSRMSPLRSSSRIFRMRSAPFEPGTAGRRDAARALCQCSRERAHQSPGCAGAGLECVAAALRKLQRKTCFPLMNLPQLPPMGDWQGSS
jgi:hypothetical protein